MDSALAASLLEFRHNQAVAFFYGRSRDMTELVDIKWLVHKTETLLELNE